MIFEPQTLTTYDGCFIIPQNATATAPACMNNSSLEELWRGFTFRYSALTINNTDEICFRIGTASALSPVNDDAYTLNVDTDGICICAKNEKALLLGFMTLLDRIALTELDGKPICKVECCRITEVPLIKERMVHFCVFPETRLFELQRFIRMCAVLKFSHVIVEFWGTLKYECLKQLSWSSGFTKDEIRPIIREARELGIELIPMFNHWGHASASRAMHGKHVVLDQEPSLQYYFSDNGWCWDIKKSCVRELLRQVRNELCELFGESKYFHIGCDEAYGFSMTEENMSFICNFINEISAELKSRGMRAIAWADMFISPHPEFCKENKYTANADSTAAEEYMLSHISRDVIIADWQYDTVKAPVETALIFKNAGFDTLLCSWDRSNDNIYSCVTTVKEHSLKGFIHTTWHTLSGNLPYVTVAAKACFEEKSSCSWLEAATLTAALLRKVYFVNGDYSKAGWSRNDVGELW